MVMMLGSVTTIVLVGALLSFLRWRASVRDRLVATRRASGDSGLADDRGRLVAGMDGTEPALTFGDSRRCTSAC